ncbi:hypothetical protein ACIGCZ_35755 [Streptomyces nigra]|uniref:hypothetical protein n=1 Tax=Streptomyces nigra TaxID=1827580 RepID=UPI0037CEE04B
MLALEEEVLWAVGRHGAAAPLIGLLLSHAQPVVYLTGLAVHRAWASCRAKTRRMPRTPSGAPADSPAMAAWSPGPRGSDGDWGDLVRPTRLHRGLLDALYLAVMPGPKSHRASRT